ncbi:MAG: MltA domain-containing protein [Thalassotalea sp.]
MRLLLIVIACSVLCFVPKALAEFTLVEQPDISENMAINVQALCKVADKTQAYLLNHADDAFAVHAGKGIIPELTLERVKATLAFMCKVEHRQQLNQTGFLKKHFDFYRWYPDKKQASLLAKKSTNKVKSRLLNAIPKNQLLLTKYYTKLLNASSERTDQYNQALYALPNDEQGLTLAQAERKQASLTRFKYTRQEIINGAFLNNELARPLIWLTEEALHDVLLQGTGVVKVDGKVRYFNVHRNNGIAYDYAIGKREQARYWYFAEVPSVLGYGKTLASKIALMPEVAFAGNVKDLGLGKLFLVNYAVNGQQQGQLGVLADQGGAFDNNLFQLDWLKGSYYGWSDYYQANKHLPDYASAWLLLKK